MAMRSEIYSDRPRTMQSGAPLEFKVKVQHRSDILMEEQIENVRNIQDALKAAFDELALARSNEETTFLRGQVEELRIKTEEMMLILKVVHKLNSELVFARLELQRALKSGEGAVTVARRRVGWLEERMERVLGKQRQKSPDRGQPQSSIVEDARFLLGELDKTLTPMTSQEGGVTETDVSRDLSEVKLALMRHDMVSAASSVSLDESPQEDRDEDPDDGLSPSGLQAEDTLLSLPTMRSHAQKRKSKGELIHVDRHDSTATSTTDDPSVRGILRKSHSPLGGDRPKSSYSEATYSETETSTSLARSEAILISEDGGLKRGKGSRVTLKSPSEDLEEAAPDPLQPSGQDVDEPMKYWLSEHHRFEMGEYSDRLCQQNPLSYHQMGLAVPGTFVDEVRPELPVPWVPKRKGSGNSDIHKIALDKLNTRLHKIYSRVREAAMLSVRGHAEGTGTNLTTDDLEQETQVRLSLKDPAADAANKPSMSRVLSQLQGSQESVTFPPLDKDRLGSSLSGRLVYYPKPLPYPEKLPITRTALDKELPRETANFSKSVPGRDSPAQRFVNQHNLLKETCFTSSLYRSKTLATGAGKGKKNYYLPTQPSDESQKKSKHSLKSAFDLVKGAVKFNAKQFRWSDAADDKMKAAGQTKWKLMKPKGGALDHSGLKWERVKSIVHHNLVSPYISERIDGARHLGALNCCDAMVMYALKERLKHDDEIRVRYEVTKSLVSLGCWEEEVLISIVTFLIDGNRDIRADLLHAMSRGKNVQYVDKKHSSFPELAKILSLLCLSDDPEDNISLDAAVCLGKLCVADENAKAKLCQIVHASKDTHVKAEAMEILVRQLHYKEQDLVDAILNHITKSPSWKNRKSAAKLLVYLGKRIVCNDNDAAENVYSILENRLWDDPNKEVRHECARVLASFDMFARACERAEKRLEDSSEEIRAQAVVTLGTLNVKNERIIRSLVEMLELDSSEFVRLVIIRTFAILNSQDKRIVRALKDKEKGDGPLSRAARKTLDAIGVPPELKKAKGSKTGKSGSSGTNTSRNIGIAISVK